MAFSSIGWKGYGVVTYCDGTTDTAGGVWAELGGGTFSYNTDTFLTGIGSIGSTYASKTGYTYYTATTSFDFTSGGTGSGTQKVADEYFYVWLNMASSSALEDMTASGDIALAFVAGADTSNHRYWTLASGDDDNGWKSGWKLFIINPTKTGTITDKGTYTEGNISMWGLWLDVSASVRADSIFIDQIAVASGVQAHSGSGTLADMINYCYGTLATRVIGTYTYKGRFNYVLGNTFIGDSTNATANTTLTATSQINGYDLSEYYDGTNWVSAFPADLNKITLEKHASYDTGYTGLNTSMFGVDNTASTEDQWIVFGKDSGATFTYDGGTFEKLSALTHDSDWDAQNCVFSDCGSRTITGGTFNNNVVALSDPIILDSVTTSGNTIKNHTSNGVTCTAPSDLSLMTGWDFERDATGYAVNIGNVTTTMSLDWKNTESGYTAGSAGTDVGVTPTGAETILCNVSAGEVLTISVATGASTPSVANSGTGTVNVTAGLLPITINVKDASTGLDLPDANVTVKREDTKVRIIAGTTNSSGVYSESVASSYNGVAFIGWVRQLDLSGTDYVQSEFSGTITTAGATINISLTPVTN